MYQILKLNIKYYNTRMQYITENNTEVCNTFLIKTDKNKKKNNKTPKVIILIRKKYVPNATPKPQPSKCYTPHPF